MISLLNRPRTQPIRLSLFAALALATPQTYSSQIFTDADWTSLGTGVNGTVSAVLPDGAGNLYVGGAFTTAGGVIASNIARWDGTNWHALGPGLDGGVTCLALDTNGNLFVGGAFSMAGNMSASCIAEWDGTNWLPLSSGLDANPNALVFDGRGNLFAGGEFISAGGKASSPFIAQWDGTNWSGVGTGMGPAFGRPVLDDPPYVNALLADKHGNIYAGGGFLFAGTNQINMLAKWDGTNWTQLGSGLGGIEHFSVYALALDTNGNLYAAGTFTSAGGAPANGIAKWNGANWSTLGSGIYSNFTGEGYAYATALTVNAAGDVFARGFFASAGGTPASEIAVWNGKSWSALGCGVTGGQFSGVFALAIDNSDHLYVGGGFTTAGTNPIPNLAEANLTGITFPGPPVKLGITALTKTTVQISWPLDHFGWKLQAQTNSGKSGLTTNWSTIPASTNLIQMTWPVTNSLGSVFFRLISP